jgi:hypothetical protein
MKKKITYINYCTVLLFAIALLPSCSKDFLEKPPESSIVDANFYKNDAQLGRCHQFIVQPGVV